MIQYTLPWFDDTVRWKRLNSRTNFASFKISSSASRINLVYTEESPLVGISLLSPLSLEFHSLGICHHQFPIGRSIEMPSRNHPSRLIESLTLMNIGWDQREGHFIFSLVCSPLFLVLHTGQNQRTLSLPASCMFIRSCNYETAGRRPRNDRNRAAKRVIRIPGEFCPSEGEFDRREWADEYVDTRIKGWGLDHFASRFEPSVFALEPLITRRIYREIINNISFGSGYLRMLRVNDFSVFLFFSIRCKIN